MKRILALALAAVSTLSFAQVNLNGAGATFPYVLYSKWFDTYKEKTGNTINYQSIGSGGGIKQFSEGTVDFGATDGPMNDDQINAAKQKLGSNPLHIPMVMGAVVLTYNVPGIGSGIKLTPAVIPDIFLGLITKWNDPRLVASNPGISLPDMPIVVVHRSDGSGTSYIFTDYLCKASGFWKDKVGKGTSVQWPVGLGGKGNEGVAGQVKQTVGSIGYTELAYAIKNGLGYATVQNKSGQWVVPTLESVTEAAKGALKNIPDDLRASITDPDLGGYPIAGMTWILVSMEQSDATKGGVLANFLWWAIHDGQAFAHDLYYAPLPKEVIKLCEKKIEMITSGGKRLVHK
jgi:phosphate transport system substrate-binding protein